jgi:hypothetical protein
MCLTRRPRELGVGLRPVEVPGGWHDQECPFGISLNPHIPVDTTEFVELIVLQINHGSQFQLEWQAPG